MPEFNKEHETIMNDMLKGVKDASADKMFGFPVYKAKGTLAVSVKSEGIVAKVGEKRAKELIGKPGITTYEPQKGRVWKDWVLMTSNFKDYKDVFTDAIKYTAANSK